MKKKKGGGVCGKKKTACLLEMGGVKVQHIPFLQCRKKGKAKRKTRPKKKKKKEHGSGA